MMVNDCSLYDVALGVCLESLDRLESELVRWVDLERAAGRIELGAHLAAVRLVREMISAAEAELSAALESFRDDPA